MAENVHVGRVGIMVPEPGKAEINPVELEDGPTHRPLDERINVLFHLRCPGVLVHQQVAANPIFAIALADASRLSYSRQ